MDERIEPDANAPRTAWRVVGIYAHGKDKMKQYGDDGWEPFAATPDDTFGPVVFWRRREIVA